jgi:predicted GTPase
MGDTPLSRHLIFGSGYPAGDSQTTSALVHLPTRHFAHGHLIGKTGHGKSSLIASLFV